MQGPPAPEASEGGGMAPTKLQGNGAAAAGSSRDAWPHARLIPSAGIRSELEQLVLLAVMHGVPEFGFALLDDLGAPKSPVIETFTEVRFKDADGKSVIPDGAIVCSRGKREWVSLVEVKTGNKDLKDDLKRRSTPHRARERV